MRARADDDDSKRFTVLDHETKSEARSIFELCFGQELDQSVLQRLRLKKFAELNFFHFEIIAVDERTQSLSIEVRQQREDENLC